MSRSLNKLVPKFRALLEKTIAETASAGFVMVPYETERSVSGQAIYWRRSRSSSVIKAALNKFRTNDAHYLADVLEGVGSQSGTWATNALPGLSWHQWGLACDLYWDANGDLPGGIEWNKTEGYVAFANAARKNGLTSGHFWRSRDSVHVQLPVEFQPMLTLAQVSKAMQERYGE
jgi:peptidoglycan L-alanyl-D-glutamate endopeptidase CwlK